VANYNIYFRKSAAKEINKRSKATLQKIIRKIESLAEQPRPAAAEKLTSQELYRIRQSDYRIVYSIQDNELTIWVIKIGHRKDIHKRL